MFRPELLSSAETLKSVRYVFTHGADAVCADRSRYSLHMCNNKFSHENLQLDINEARALEKKLYVVTSIVPHNARLRAFIHDPKPVVEVGSDALIMSDPGLITLAREHFPRMPIHLSVQANAVNWATVEFWQQMGLTRVILSRELSLEEIEEIHDQVPDMEIKIFVHSALRMAHSGRCLLPGYINKRDPNQDACANTCRWEYNVQKGKEGDAGNIVHRYKSIPVQDAEPTLDIGALTDKVFMIEEAQRPGEYMATFEDEHGIYIMSSRDLCAIVRVECPAKMGIHPPKVEGHAESFYCCVRAAQAYCGATDDAAAEKLFDTNLLETLEGLAYRGHTEGFLCRHTHNDYQNYEYGYSVFDHQQPAGEFISKRKGDLAAVTVKNKFFVGDSLELMAPQGSTNFTLEHTENAKGEAMPIVSGDGYAVWLPVPQDFELNYALLMRNFFGETTRNPHGK